MSTLAVVEEILREVAVPMSVREIVERAGARLPSKSKTPDTVVARDLSMDIKRKGESSAFVRSSPGRYTLRSLFAPQAAASAAAASPVAGESATSLTSSLLSDRAAPMAARRPTSAVAVPVVASAAPGAGPTNPASSSGAVPKDGFAG